MKHRVKIGILFFFGIVLGVGSTFANRDLEGVDIISREEWGADESIRRIPKSKSEWRKDLQKKAQQELENLKKTNPKEYQKKIQTQQKSAEESQKAQKISSVRGAYMRKNYPEDWSYDAVNEKDGEHYLIYEDQFHYAKTKIVIHHTAMDYDLNWTDEQIKEHLQKIFVYHTIDRDFGDIGYNFLIDGKGNIYEGRHGGEGAVGMHVSYNNVATIGISLMGNFEKVQPTQAQLDALTDLVSALAKKYHIDPYGKAVYHQPKDEEPYIYQKVLGTIVGHGDIAPTACPGKNLKSFLPELRAEVKRRLEAGENPQNTSVKTTKKTDSKSSKLSFPEKLKMLVKTNPELIQEVIKELRKTAGIPIHQATNLTKKVAYAYSSQEIRPLLEQNISVLLYDLTTNYQTFSLRCEGGCVIETSDQTLESDTLEIMSQDSQLFFTLSSLIDSSVQPQKVDSLTVKSQKIDGLVTIENYPRVSYAKIPWNTFRGSLTFQKGEYTDKKGEKKSDRPLVINTLPVTDYLKGIVETNDTESLEKNKVMALLSKMYVLFYLEGKNRHPSIPENAPYQAIDDPDLFQKYAGAGVEKTLTKWYQALEETENEIILYNGEMPILPYFSCSPSFTLSAQEKFGWTDTPYLQSVIDLGGCGKFQGHGVGLPGQGAEFLAKKGMSYQDIIEYFYPGVEVVKLG